MLRTLWVVLCVAACSGKTEKAPAKPADDAAPIAAVSDARVKKEPSEAKPLAPELRNAYKRALSRGRSLAKSGKWGEAAQAFEEALGIVPMDERALSELSWAALQAGDFARAKHVAQSGVRAGSDSKVVAASYYNLGRAEEAMGKSDQAKVHYLASLRLRPNETVKARLEKLGGQVSANLPAAADEMPCVKQRDRGALCSCVVEQLSPGMNGDRTCDFKPGPGATKDLFLARVGTSMEEELLLVEERAGKLSVLAVVASAYTPGAFGIDEEYELDVSEVKKVGDRQILWLEAKHNRSDRDMGIDEDESVSSRLLTACALDSQGRVAGACVKLTTSYDYVRDVSGLYEGDDPPEHSPGLPRRESFALRTTVLSDGQLEVVLTDGALVPFAKAYIGRHRLW